MRKHLYVFGVILLAMASANGQNVPQSMSYQGYVTDPTGTPIADGNFNFTFALYTVESGGVALWTEAHPTVAVRKGLFNVILGRGNPPNALTIQFDQQYFLGIRINPDAEMIPRVRLTTSAYSFRARTAHEIRDGAITDASVAPFADIAASKLQSTVLTESEIVAGSGVTVTNIAGTLTVSATPGAVTLNGDVTGPAASNTMANDAVTTSKIANDAVTAAKIAPNVVSSISGVTNDAGDIALVAGSNVTISPDNASKSITISASGGGGLSLPYAGTDNSSSDAFRITQNGTGRALYGTNSSVSTPAITAVNSSIAPNAPVFTALTGATEVFTVDREGDVSANGIMTADAFTSTTTLNTGTPALGRMYRDNVVYVWGKVKANGSFTGQSFGIQSVTRNSDTTYTVTFKTTFTSIDDYAVVVSPVNNATFEIATPLPLTANSVKVKIHYVAFSSTNIIRRDYYDDFFIIVTGRP